MRALGAAALAAMLATPPCAAGELAAPAAPDASPTLPDQVDPPAPLYPDYFGLALAQTSLTDDAAFRPLRLQSVAGQETPTLIVLPVQTQAFDFAPTFRALLGARLDQELQRRHIDATRQTDIVDWRGPFVRRLDEDTIAAFAAEHPQATLLSLYVGHDGRGHAFITLATRRNGKTTLTQTGVDVQESAYGLADELLTLDIFTQLMPHMLATLGLGDANAATAAVPAGNAGCRPDAWRLEDLPSNAPPDIAACHALLMGTLMPDPLAIVATRARPGAPDRAAWLARAWVEASSLERTVPAMKGVATLAALQLRIDRSLASAAPLVDSPDTVVQPLARMLSARERAQRSPARGVREAAADYVERSSNQLPPFARAVVEERARLADGFLQVDLCPMSLALPHFKVPAGCEYEVEDAPAVSGTASRGQAALLDDWRLAAAYKGLYYEGTIQGNAAGLARMLADMPPSLARHPFVRVMRYSTRHVEKTAPGIDAYMAQARGQVADFAQAVATLQRDDALIGGARFAEDLIPAAQTDPAVRRARDDVARLQSVEAMDLWAAMIPRPASGHVPTEFLSPGSFIEARSLAMRARAQRMRPAETAALAPSAPGSRAGTPVEPAVWFEAPDMNALPSRERLERTLAANPRDEQARRQLATVALEQGASVADARKIIEARTRSERAEDAISESDEWSKAARLFFYTGELDVAREYFQRAQDIGTGSDEEMHAAVRLRQIDGDMRGALAAAHRRMERYDSVSSLREETCLLFLLHRRDEAWAELLPHLQTTSAKLPWEAALVGHRLDGTPLSQMPAWMIAHRVADLTTPAMMTPGPSPRAWLQTYQIQDRLPSDSDFDIHPPGPVAHDMDFALGGGRLMRTAILGRDPAHPTAFVTDMHHLAGSDNLLLQPFYGWALWNEKNGRDPALDIMRETPVGSRFPAILARAMIQAADGQREPALQALTAARFELARLADVPSFGDDYDRSPYDFVLATWLMSRKTGDPAYAAVGLKIARAYQRVWPWAAWTYAGEALLGRDPKAGQVAACRAYALDAGSMFLHESGLHPDPKSALCRKVTAW